MLIMSTPLSAIAQTQSLSIFNAYVSDSSGNMLTDSNLNMLSKASCNQQVIITTNIKNSGKSDEQVKLDYVIYAQTGDVAYAQRQASTVLGGQTAGPSISWTAPNSGTYKILITLFDDAGNKLDSTTTVFAASCDTKIKDEPSTERVLPTVNKKEKLSDEPKSDSEKIFKGEAVGIEPQTLTKIKALMTKLRTTATAQQKQILDELEKEISSLRQTPNTSFGEKAKAMNDNIKSKSSLEKNKMKSTAKKIKGIKDNSFSGIAIDESGQPRPIKK